jgi:class 3 adenylate cyclase
MADRSEEIRSALNFEREIGNLIELSGAQMLPIRTGGLDYLFLGPGGRRTGVVVKFLSGKSVSNTTLTYAVYSARRARCAVLLLITPGEPAESQIKRLKENGRETGLEVAWLTRAGLAERLKVPDNRDKATQQYGMAAVLIHEAPTPREAELRASGIWSRLPLAARGADLDKGLAEFLRIGETLEDLTFVVADIRNFSSIVLKSRPRYLQQAMTSFYRNCREAIRAHDGTLIDFAGDGVLAVFDYPILGDNRPSRALKCAADLIEVGRYALPELAKHMNADIATGVRVGVATSDVHVVDGGSEDIDPRLLGDALNLATRLQSLAPTDGMLIDNVTHVLLEEADASLLAKADTRHTTIRAEDAKGQLVSTSAWTVDEAPARTLAHGHEH